MRRRAAATFVAASCAAACGPALLALALAPARAQDGQQDGAQGDAPGELRADAPRARPRLGRDALERRARGTLDLGLEVLRSLPHGNAVVSPQAIAQVLGLTYAGARGQTAAELGRALRFGGGPGAPGAAEDGLPALNALDQALAQRAGTGRSGAFRLRVAPAVWLQRGRPVLPEYLGALATHFGLGVRTADFAGDLGAARAAINGWAAEVAGDGSLDDLGRAGVSGDLRLVLLGVAAFDAAWQRPFEPGRTVQGNFSSQGAGLLQVPLMSVTAPMTVATIEGLRAVDVPFARDDLRLLVLVPEQGEVGELARSLTAAQLARVTAELRQPPRPVVLSLPRVAVRTRVDLREALTSAGVRALFTSRADLTGIDPAGRLRVDAALHDVRVDLDEGGAGGAGAAALGARPALLLPAPWRQEQTPASFAVERPFLFLIRDRVTGAALLLGRVMDPR